MSFPAWVRPALAGLAVLLALPVSWPAPLAGWALSVLLGIVPGALAAVHLAPRGGSTLHTMLALVLSPFLVAAPGAVLMALGASAATAAKEILVGVALALLLVPRPRREARWQAESPVPGVAAALWTVLVTLFLCGNPALAPRSDGWFHAAVSQQIAARGLPPEDPFFAGLPLLYFWGYHVWAALWLAAAPAVSVWTPLLLLNLSGAAAVMIGICLVTRRLGGDGRAMRWTAVLTVAGYAPFAWLQVLGRMVSGEVTGLDEARRLLLNGADGIMLVMMDGMQHSSMVFFGDKFLLPTPFGLGLALFAAWLLLFLDFVRAPSLRTAIALGLVQASAFFLHSVVGWATAGLVAGWWVAAMIRYPRGERELGTALFGLPWISAAVLLLLSPYLRATSVGKQDSIGLGFGASAWISLLFGGAAYLAVGVPWLLRRASERGPARELLVLASLLALAGVAVRMPGSNQSKFLNLLFLLLAPAAALGWSGLHDRLAAAPRRLLAAGLALALGPTVALCLWGLATEAGQFAAVWARPSTPAERAGMRWARDHTEPDAVFADPALSLDMTVLATRSAVWGEGWEKNWGYPAEALAARRRVVDELRRPGPLSPETAAFLREMGREIIVVDRLTAPDSTGSSAVHRAGEPGFRLLYRNSDIAFYRWEGGS